MVNSISDATDELLITNIFTTTDKFITVKIIILIIEFCIFATKRIKCFIQLFSDYPEIKILDEIIHLSMIFSI